VGNWRCPCGSDVDLRRPSCPECGTVRPRGPSTPTVPPGESVDPTRCHWRGSHGARCLMRGTAIHGDTRYCTWHDELRTLDRARLAESFDEFERWCLRLRARGYCGPAFEWSHADIPWLFALVTGETSAPLDPPSRVGCAKTSCPYGWNGKRVSDAFPLPVAAAPPSATDRFESDAVPRRAPPTRRPGRAPGFGVVTRTGELVAYRCLVCRSEFSRDLESPPPSVCPNPTCSSRPSWRGRPA
jgi:hypothetical protein